MKWGGHNRAPLLGLQDSLHRMVGTSGQGQAHRKHTVNAVISTLSVKVSWEQLAMSLAGRT